MPVTKSAKRALRVAARRKVENVVTRATYKKAVKAVRRAVDAGTGSVSELMSKAQSTLDTAAKNNTIHRNKAARLKSRLAKKMGDQPAAPAKAKKTAAPKKAATKKPATTKAPAKKK